VTLCGLAASGWSAVLWSNTRLGPFVFLLAMAVVTSRMKVRLPLVEGTVSVNFLFILLGAIELNAPQTVLIAAAATLSQCLWKPRHRVTLIQLVFNVSSSAYSGFGCHLVFANLAASSVPSLSYLPVLPVVGAVATYFFLNTLSVSGIIFLTQDAQTQKKTLVETWHGSFLYTAPQYLIGALLVLILDRLYSAFGGVIFLLVLPVLFLIYYSYRLYLGQLEQEKKHVTEMSELQMRTIRGLALAIEAKDSTTHYHVRRVRRFALTLAAAIPVSALERQAVEAAALLHDIGKLAIPEHILSKPGKLTDEEFAKMKTHTVVGAEILESIGFPYPVVPIVRHHHEKWDGSGYPDGLKGREIPIGARILSVVDCFDALTSDRQYRRAMGAQEAVALIRSEAGRSYDPAIVTLFEKHYQALNSESHESLCADPALGGGSVASAAPHLNSLPTAEVAAAAGFMSSIAAAREEFQHLLDVTTELGNSLRTEEVFSLLSHRLKTMAPYDCMVIFTLRESVLVPLFSVGVDSEFMGGHEIPVGDGLSGWVVKNRRPVTNGDPRIEPGYRNRTLAEQALKSAISVPLESPSGVIGALTLYSRTPDFYNADHLRVLLSLSAKASLTIENALRFDEARKNATTDELTGLPNTRSLHLELERELSFCRRGNHILSVLVLDLNGFKQVNDRFGHLAGNRLLARVAVGLTACCREHDYCARVGGDEFVMMLRDAGPLDLDRRLEQLCDAVVQAGIDVLGERVVSLSVGSAFYPSDAETAEALVSQADSRMYEMKRAGKLGRSGVTAEAAEVSFAR
jgi:diguanylate cyclase (GGDEF)-like protein/putative nucleotidyltransferase with HDIG domain